VLDNVLAEFVWFTQVDSCMAELPDVAKGKRRGSTSSSTESGKNLRIRSTDRRNQHSSLHGRRCRLEASFTETEQLWKQSWRGFRKESSLQGIEREIAILTAKTSVVHDDKSVGGMDNSLKFLNEEIEGLKSKANEKERD